MAYYIVCRKKRNNPRMNVRICQQKCDLKDDCKEYISHTKILVQNETAPLSIEPRSASSGAA